MSKKRYIDTKFWSDNYITELDPLERYLFLYFLSNEHTNLCGVYEIPLRIMAFESGLDVDMLKKMLDRFEKDNKAVYRNGWILIKNFIKNQVLNPSVLEGIQRELLEVPIELKDFLKTDSIQDVPSQGTDKLGKVRLSKVKLSSNDNFEKFWKEYPKKELKKKSYEIWLRKKLDGSLPAILAFIEKAKNTDRWKKGYVKQPPVFLNGECWNDDIEAYNDKEKEPSVIKINKF